MQQGDPIQTAKLVASVDQVSNGRAFRMRPTDTVRHLRVKIEAYHERYDGIGYSTHPNIVKLPLPERPSGVSLAL